MVPEAPGDGFGLEAGSKPELLLALAVMRRAASLLRSNDDAAADDASDASEKDRRGKKRTLVNRKPLLVCNGHGRRSIHAPLMRQTRASREQPPVKQIHVKRRKLTFVHYNRASSLLLREFVTIA